MGKKPKVPEEIIRELTLKEPEPEPVRKNIVTLIGGKKQFAIKIPLRVVEKVGWKGGDKIEIETENSALKLKRTKAD